ncbi:MAG: hypothetical protein JO307_28670 [Bryobacterales bacterium]|nr:hypothetical protein [Bryobacterales bacterium]MBV9400589.1 hypothetical protein [Bryobacterales bacterium]
MHHKSLVAIGLIPLIMSPVLAAKDPDDDTRPAAKHGVRGFIRGTFTPTAIGMAGLGAGINQGTDTPHEWGQGAAGFGRRFASAMGKHIIGHGIHYAVSRALHEEIDYRPSGKTGFAPRLEYALLSTVITRKTTTGDKTINAGELAGAFGSGLISRAWQPASTASIAHGFASGGISLGVNAGLHVTREFWPEIRHPHQHQHRGPVAPAIAADADSR